MRKSALKSASTQFLRFLICWFVGDKEVETGTVAVRTRTGEDLGTLSIKEFCDHLQQDVVSKGRKV